MASPGSRIYECRLLKGWSQAELAARAGIAQANLSNIEKGKRDMTVSTLLRIAAALEVDPSMLIEPWKTRAIPEMTRTRIETIAEVVLNPKLRAAPEVRELAGLFRVVLSGMEPRVSTKKIQLAWDRLRQRFSGKQIEGISRRVEDARQRQK